MRQLMDHQGFEDGMVVAGRKAALKNKHTHPVFLAIDRVATPARRSSDVGRRVRVTPRVTLLGSLPYQLLVTRAALALSAALTLTACSGTSTPGSTQASSPAPTSLASRHGLLVGARAADESFAAVNATIGPVKVTRVFYQRGLPATFTRGDIPAGVKIIVSYKQASPHTASYVKSIPAGADVEICYHHEPEADYPSGAQFVEEFQAQEHLIHQVNPAIPVAFIAGSFQWVSPGAKRAFIPPQANRYYLDSYQRSRIVPLSKDPRVQNFLAALKVGHHGFDGLSEYGRGLTSITDPRLAAKRAAVIREDGTYLRSLGGVKVWVYWFTQSKGSGLRWRFTDPASVAAWRAEAQAR